MLPAQAQIRTKDLMHTLSPTFLFNLPPFLPPSYLFDHVTSSAIVLRRMLPITALATRTAQATLALINCIEESSYVGPENGHLVIIGGNLTSDAIFEKILSLAGGPSAPLIVIPTAGGDATYNDSIPVAETFRRLGATDVKVLHTYDPAVADTDEFIAPLKEAKGIFFGGGRQWRLVDAYAGTKSERAFQAVLDRGGVISGSSAGASIQASLCVSSPPREQRVPLLTRDKPCERGHSQ